MQRLGAQLCSRFCGPFWVVLQVDVRLHGVHAPDAVLFGCALEDPGIVGHDEPEIGAAGIVKVPESINHRGWWVHRDIHGRDSERRELRVHPRSGEPGHCVLDAMLAEHITDDTCEGITGSRSDVAAVDCVLREAVGLSPGVEKQAGVLGTNAPAFISRQIALLFQT
jgi:hypothetical protein